MKGRRCEKYIRYNTSIIHLKGGALGIGDFSINTTDFSKNSRIIQNAADLAVETYKKIINDEEHEEGKNSNGLP